jgi:hypothetical protein
MSDEVRRARENLETHLTSIDSRIISALGQVPDAGLGGMGVAVDLAVAQEAVNRALTKIGDLLKEAS